MNRATYNITSDKLKLWLDDRLSAEDYATAKRAKFSFWHGSKCFVAKWSTQAEDFILARGIEILDDDSPDDVEARVERFAGYAEQAEQGAESAQTYLETQANTDRRRENAANAIAKNLSAAEHWQQRIEGAIRHAAYKENPGVIARRIKGLEADQRKFAKEIAKFNACKNNWTKIKGFDGEKQAAAALYVSGRSSCTPTGTWSDLRDAKITAAQAAENTLALCDRELTRYGRWLSHTENRLLYERAALGAAGGLAADVGLEKGGAIKSPSYSCNGWVLITKVNKTTVEIFNPACTWRRLWKIDKERVTETATKAQVDAGEIQVVRPEQIQEAA